MYVSTDSNTKEAVEIKMTAMLCEQVKKGIKGRGAHRRVRTVRIAAYDY